MWCINGMNAVAGLLVFSSVGLLFSAALLVWPEQGNVSAGLLGAGAVNLLWATFTREGGGFLVGLGLVLLAAWEMRAPPPTWSAKLRVPTWARRLSTWGRPAPSRARPGALPPALPPAPACPRQKPRLQPRVREHGQALIEFALVLPVLLLVLIGILEFGRLYMEYFNLTYLTHNVAQAAARLGGNVPELASVVENNHLPPLRIAEVELHIDTLSPDGGLQCAGDSTICACEYGDVIRVTTRYPTGVRILGFREALTLQVSATLFCWRGGLP